MVKKIYALSLLRCVLTFVFVKPENSLPKDTEIKVISEKTEITSLYNGKPFEKDYDSYEILHTIQCSCEKDNMLAQITVLVGIDYDSEGRPYIAEAVKPSSFGGGGRFEWEETLGFSDITAEGKLVSHVMGQFIVSEMVEQNPVGAMMPGMFYNAGIRQKWYFRSEGVNVWLNLTAEEIISGAK